MNQMDKTNIKSLESGIKDVLFQQSIQLQRQYIQSQKNKTMKGINMKAPALSEIYTQKMLHQAHKKKLQQIRQQRKSFMGFNHTRLAQIQHMKQTKNKSFAHKFNQQSNQINRQNLRLLIRLQKTKPYFRYTSHENRQDLEKSRDSASFVTPYIKKKIGQQQKENFRLSNRVHSISSTLNQKNLMRDFVKSQRIKQRITRYTSQNNKVSLKSQKYISNLSQSKLSNSSENNIIRPKTKSTTANYYKKEEIMKNKVQNIGSSLARIKNRASSTLDENNEENKHSFFTTEPQKNISRRKTNKR